MTPRPQHRPSAAGDRLRALDGPALRDAFRAGIAQVLAASGMLNKINVYPVADGDTGTNLALTLGAVDQALAGDGVPGVGDVLALAADAAVDGARGNSGAIMAEFLQGLADTTAESRAVDVRTLAEAFANADRYARGALDAPVEGTILTVISSVAHSIAAQARAGAQDLRSVLDVAVVAARAAVEATRDALPALRRAGVVDAGAHGFLLFMEGVAATITGATARGPARVRVAAVPTELADACDAALAHAADPTTGFRYCTECLVLATGVDRRRLRDELALLGDSVVLAGSRDRLKIHVHADDPGAVFALARRYGTVTAEKADDMHRQAQARNARDRRIAVVTDSGADLPEDLCDALGIHVVPLRIHFADRTYLDKVTLTSGDFLREVAASPHHPQTSQPAPGDFRRVFEFLATHHEHVLAVSLAGRVSGTLQAAKAAARRSAAPERISVVDSQNVSVGQGLIALYAAECAREGLPLAEVVAATEAAVAATRVYGVLTDLRYATRGGRLPRVARWLARVLPVRPVLRVGGGSLGVSGVFTRHTDPVAVLLRHATSGLTAGSRYRFAVAHAGMPGAAAELRTALREALPAAGNYISELGAATSVHGGPGTLGVAVQELAPNAPGPATQSPEWPA